MKIHFIRHATLILYLNNKKILVDPVLSPRSAISAVKSVPNKNNNPLVDLPLTADSIVNCDAVLVTHTHRDHFDDMAVKLLPKNLLVFCQPEDEVKIKEFGFINVKPIEDTFIWEGMQINRTKGKHGHGIIARRMAPVSGFVISAPGEPVVYLTGDTVWCSCTEKALAKYTPEIVICNCGEAKFSRGKAITMDAQDILAICKKSSVVKVAAVHMDAWNHCRLSRKSLRDFIINNNINDQVFVPEDGEMYTF